MIDWQAIDTVLLDMDGTVLDLRFDTVFWNDLLPSHYAAVHGMTPAAAQTHFAHHIARVHGTLDYYCIDAWERFTGLPITRMQNEVEELIDFRPHAIDLLDEMRAAGKSVYLVTNAHPISFELKDARLALTPRFDGVHSAHTFGLPKESAAFWPALRDRLSFDPRRTLFIDDTSRVLDAAHAFGIALTLQVTTPDSGGAAIAAQPPHRGVASFAPLLDGLRRAAEERG